MAELPVEGDELMAFTKREVWDNAFTAWWIKYLQKRYRGFSPAMRHMPPYAEMEDAAIDVAAWARKRALRERR